MSTSWYESQSNHNKDTHDFLHTKNPSYVDWEITTLFYAALHLVNGYFKRNGIPLPRNHHDRSILMNEKLHSLYPTYRKLYALSIKARYKWKNKMNDSNRKMQKDVFLS